jgi:microcystin degradation protein MlrC
MLVRAIRGDYTPTHATRKVPIISPTVLQWTGASPWMDLVQRALIWEARSPDTYVNVFFGFPWADVPDAGMTIEVLTNGQPELAQHVATDMAGFAWRKREALLKTTKIHTIREGVALAREAVGKGATPVVLADHSDRSGYATWLLREIMAQKLAKTLVVTVADREAIEVLTARGVKPGDAFDMAIGGRADPSAGEPVRVQGRVLAVTGGARRDAADRWVHVGFGEGNVLVVSPFLAQIMEPNSLSAIGINPASFDVIAIKSRVHFRRGFDDTGFAPTILLVEPDEPFLGTVRLNGLHYENLDLAAYYPYGKVAYDTAATES